MEAVKRTAVVLHQAGIEGAETFTEFLSGIEKKAFAAVEQTPAIDAVETREDYTYARNALAALRKVKAEAEDGRKRITRQLDEAKAAAIEYTNASVAPVDDAIARLDKAKRTAEAEWRRKKERRLCAWWEESYPALALCIGSADPLVPFENVFDPDWVKRISEVDKDKRAQEAMAEIAGTIAKGQKAIEMEDRPEGWKRAARAELFHSFDLSKAYKAGTEAEAQSEAVEAIKAAQADATPAPVTTEGQQPQNPANSASGPSKWVLTVELHSREEVKRVRDILVKNGIHGSIRAFV